MVCPNCEVDIAKFEREQRIKESFEFTYGADLRRIRTRQKFLCCAWGAFGGLLTYFCYASLKNNVSLFAVFEKFFLTEVEAQILLPRLIGLLLLLLLGVAAGSSLTSRKSRKEKRLWQKFCASFPE